MRVEVVHKVPKLQTLLRDDGERVERLQSRAPDVYRGLHDAAERQQRSLESVVEAFSRHGHDVSTTAQDLFERVSDGVQVVVVVGGDGTVLDVAHSVESQPILAINSDPDRSVGYFCAVEAQHAETAARRVANDEVVRTRLHRIQLHINGEPYGIPCLNDILIANAHPAMMSRYVLSTGLLSEKQSSSGLWISTPAGSTGGIRSAGGTVLPLSGAMLQYLVREPYMPRGTGYRMSRGVRHLSEGLTVRSLMTGGRIYVDGPYHEIAFEIGDVMTLSEGPGLTLLDVHAELRGR